MASGKLRSMRRDLRDPASIEHCKPRSGRLTSSTSASLLLSPSTAAQLSTIRRSVGGYSRIRSQIVLIGLFRVWKPDFEKCWLTIGTEAEPDEQKDGWQIARAKELFLIGYPDGVPDAATGKEVQKRLATACKDRGWKLPSLDTIARARGRRR